MDINNNCCITENVYRVRQYKRPHCAKCIIVPVVLNVPVKFSDTVHGIVYHLQY